MLIKHFLLKIDDLFMLEVWHVYEKNVKIDFISYNFLRFEFGIYLEYFGTQITKN